MVRGLITRQIFVLLDLALVLFCIGTFAIVSMRFVASSTLGESGEVAMEEEEFAPAVLARVSDLPGYDVIKTSGLFGPAGKWDPDAVEAAPEPAPVVQETLPETELKLALHGVVALEPEGPFSSAVIEDTLIRESKRVFFVGDEVTPQVVLAEVYDREVILLNKRKVPAIKERLRMDDSDEDELMAINAAALAQQSTDLRSTVTERVNLNRAEIVQDLYDSYADLVTKIKPEIVRDDTGQVVGITAKNIQEIPLAEKLGITEGDVLQTVNNEKIDSQQKIMEMVQKYQNASSFRIGIQRGGKPKIITYRLN